MYTRKTEDEWIVQGDYGSGFEDVTYEESYKEAKEMLRCYNENEVGVPHRIKKHRIPKRNAE